MSLYGQKQFNLIEQIEQILWKNSESRLKHCKTKFILFSGNCDQMYNLFEEKIHQRLLHTGQKYLCKQIIIHQVVNYFLSPHTPKISCSWFRTTLG